MARRKQTYDIPEGNVITMRNVSMSYTKNTAALDNVSLDIKQGEFVFIVGDSGSGKSTLIKLLLRELEATEGEINVLGYDLKKLKRRKVPKFRRNLGIVFQDFRLLKDRNIYENVAFAQRVIQASSRSIRQNVPATLAKVGLANKYKNKPSEISGGEQQRVALARALVNRPLILLADEPTGNLDPRNSWEIMKLLEEINEQEGMTVVVVTHNREIVNAMHKRVITVRRGQIIEDERAGSYTADENQKYEESPIYEDELPTGYTEELPGGYTEEIPAGYTEELPAGYTDEIPAGYAAERPRSAAVRPEARGEKRVPRFAEEKQPRYVQEPARYTEEPVPGEYTSDLTEELLDLDGKL